MENTHPLSLATGTLPEFSPPEVVDAAAQAAYWGCGVWFDAETWTGQTTKDTKKAFQESGLVPLDIEVLWIQPTGWDDNFERLLDAGAEIGVRNALIVSSDPDMSSTADQFGRLCDLAQARNIFA
ncbi:MAG: sugar phosphate isomerase/epimerase, partial [Alphaproteobacteria bacterium]|nr:sugar phosphate isomerase/epimerase [Alphaproteobacteria bacterium]